MNASHGFDTSHPSIKKCIDLWSTTMKYEDAIKKSMEKNHETFFNKEQDYEKWKSNDVNSDSIKKINKAKDGMVAGLTLFMDSLGSLKEENNDFFTDPDFLNLIFMTAFAKSNFYDKTLHWAKAEQNFQKTRNTNLPGSVSGTTEEHIVRENELAWYSIQFLYRQFEFTRYVPNYEIVTGIWGLENKLHENTVSLIDNWYYIHKDKINSKTDLTDYLQGYFFRYNAKMTSDAQAQTLYILNNLFRHSLSKMLGTMENYPWFNDALITNSADGNLPFSKNIIPHKIDLKKLSRFNKAPIVSQPVAGMRLIPSEQEDPVDFQDDESATKIVAEKYKDKTSLIKDISVKEKSRDGKGYTKDDDNIDQNWDQDVKQMIKLENGFVWVKNGIVTKIKNLDGDKVEKLKCNGKKWQVGCQV